MNHGSFLQKGESFMFGMKNKDMQECLSQLLSTFEKTRCLKSDDAFTELIIREINKYLNSFSYIKNSDDVAKIIKNFYDVSLSEKDFDITRYLERNRLFFEMLSNYTFIPMLSIIKELKKDDSQIFITYGDKAVMGQRPINEKIEISILNIDGLHANQVIQRLHGFFPENGLVITNMFDDTSNKVPSVFVPGEKYGIEGFLVPECYNPFGAINEHLLQLQEVEESNMVDNKSLVEAIRVIVNREYLDFMNRALREFVNWLATFELDKTLSCPLEHNKNIFFNDKENSKSLQYSLIFQNFLTVYKIDFLKLLNSSIPLVRGCVSTTTILSESMTKLSLETDLDKVSDEAILTEINKYYPKFFSLVLED